MSEYLIRTVSTHELPAFRAIAWPTFWCLLDLAASTPTAGANGTRRVRAARHLFGVSDAVAISCCAEIGMFGQASRRETMC